MVKHVKKLFLGLLIATIWSICIAEVKKTPITIQQFQKKGDESHLRIKVLGAHSDTKVLVFYKKKGRLGFFPVIDHKDFPLASRIDNEVWEMTFTTKKGIEDIYAIACINRTRSGWNTDRDLHGFRYLGFDDATSIGEVLRILDNFDWTPTGFTNLEGYDKIRP